MRSKTVVLNGYVVDHEFTDISESNNGRQYGGSHRLVVEPHKSRWENQLKPVVLQVGHLVFVGTVELRGACDPLELVRVISCDSKRQALKVAIAQRRGITRTF